MAKVDITEQVKFDGKRFIVQAHYGKLTDYVEEAFTERAEMEAARDRHLAAGANVQVKLWSWVEVKQDSGWYSAKAYPLNVGKGQLIMGSAEQASD